MHLSDEPPAQPTYDYGVHIFTKFVCLVNTSSDPCLPGDYFYNFPNKSLNRPHLSAFVSVLVLSLLPLFSSLIMTFTKGGTQMSHDTPQQLLN